MYVLQYEYQWRCMWNGICLYDMSQGSSALSPVTIVQSAERIQTPFKGKFSMHFDLI